MACQTVEQTCLSNAVTTWARYVWTAPKPSYRRGRCCSALVRRQHSAGHSVAAVGPGLRDIWDFLRRGGTHRIDESTEVWADPPRRSCLWVGESAERRFQQNRSQFYVRSVSARGDLPGNARNAARNPVRLRQPASEAVHHAPAGSARRRPPGTRLESPRDLLQEEQFDG